MGLVTDWRKVWRVGGGQKPPVVLETNREGMKRIKRREMDGYRFGMSWGEKCPAVRWKCE